jgi:NAD(P)-dependent dehydrogenase (short-subunit alcohol dehydrogenase family)
VCFASSAAYQIALLGPEAESDALVEEPLAAGFLDRAAARFDDSGIAYAWAKRGVIRAAARAAVTWGRRGGRVNSLSPGLIDTGMGRQEFEAQPVMQVMLDNTPAGRLGSASEIADVVAFLVSDTASFVSGIDVLVDGGGLEGFRTFMRGMA